MNEIAGCLPELDTLTGRYEGRPRQSLSRDAAYFSGGPCEQLAGSWCTPWQRRVDRSQAP